MSSKSIVKKNSITKLTYSAMLIGLSAIGALIKFPGTTIALDSMPGFFAAIFLGPGMGAIVAGIGHLLTALTSGFPLTLPMHTVVTLEMALFALGFGWLYKKVNSYVAMLIAILLNGPISALLAVPLSIALGLSFNGWVLFKVIIIPLSMASIINVILAHVLYGLVTKLRK